MDELSLLRELRGDVVPPAETRERSRRALEAAIRGRRRRPRLLLVAAVAGVLLGAGAAYALARQFLVGDPWPRAVKDQTAMLNVVKGELIARLGAGLGISAEETRLAATMDASTGPVYLWVAPAAVGDYCLLQVVGTELRDGRPNMGGGHCNPHGEINSSLTGTRVRGGRWLMLLQGRVGPRVRRLEAELNGRRLPVPLSGRFFLAEVPGVRDSEIPEVTLVGYDAAGREVAR